MLSPEVGNKIVFKASSSYENGVATKTAYSGDGTFSGETLVRERIDWIATDVIRISSDKASLPDYSANWSDYAVTPSANSGSTSFATIAPKNSEGLVWGSGTHEFYSTYPPLPFNGREVEATVPAIQTYNVSGTELKPDMDYAYMYAACKTGPSTSVTLSFRPMFTAFEFTIDSMHDQQMTLASFEMTSSSCALSGRFKAEISAEGSGEGSAVYTLIDTENSVSINFTGGLVINKGTPKTFTVFTLPTDITDVTIKLTNSQGETKSLMLKEGSTPVSFSACKKYRITNLAIPGAWTYSMNEIDNIVLSSDAEKISGGSRNIRVTSNRLRASSREPFPWRALVSIDGITWYEADDPNWPEWLTLSSYSGSGNSDNVVVNVGANDVEKHIYGVGSDIADILRALEPKGSENNPYDLSKYTITGAANNSGASTTANTYVVSAPGWYMFPLVYGNAIKNGSTNTVAYQPNIYSATAMSSFFGADGNPIQSPYILQDSGLTLSGEYNACVVWEDVMPGYETILQDNVSVVDAPAGAGLSCKYIRFYIAPEDIKPGNSVIALRDKGNGNKILWSWHIWIIPNSDLTTSSVLYRPTEATTAEQTILDVNLGWSAPVCYSPLKTQARRAWIKIVQDSPGTESRTFTVDQLAYLGVDYEADTYSCTYYQWGRKDPFLPSKGSESINKCCISPGGYTITQGTNGNPLATFNGQHNALYSVMIRNPFRQYRHDGMAPILNAWNAYNTEFVTDSQTLKTIYDPCPPGFSVPRLRSFTGFTTTGTNASAPAEINGVWSDANIPNPAGWMMSASADKTNYTLYFPALGFRSYIGVISLQNRGYYWTSAPYEETTTNLFADSGFFTQYRVDPLYNIPNSHACAIRPVVEQ